MHMRLSAAVLVLVSACGQPASSLVDASTSTDFDAGTTTDAGLVDSGIADAGTDGGTPDSGLVWPANAAGFEATRGQSIWEDPCALPDGGSQWRSSWSVVLTTREATIDACLCTGGTGNCSPALHRATVVLDAGVIDELTTRLNAMRRAEERCGFDAPQYEISVNSTALHPGTNSCPVSGTIVSGLEEVFVILERVAKEH